MQNGGLCFQKIVDYTGCGIHESRLAFGFISQLSFENRFFIEDMDYSFSADVRVAYHPREPFIEILCLDSIQALNCERNQGEAVIQDGVHILFHQDTQGELRFSTGIPVRGIRIVIKGQFFNSYLVHRFPQEALDFILLGKTKNECLQSPQLQMIFSQIRHSIRSGAVCELYYESKIIELLYTISQLNNPALQKRRLSSTDLAAVEQVKAILAEHLSDAPTIAHMAVMTGTSQSKLQNDFKAACGCTIHDYLRSIRMAKALHRIEHKDLPLYIIAQELGYHNAGRFSEIFKETYGITPDIYRKGLRSWDCQDTCERHSL